MPLYDVRCKKCGHERELFRGINEENPICDRQSTTVADADRKRREITYDTDVCGGEQETLISAVVGRVRGGTPRFHR